MAALSRFADQPIGLVGLIFSGSYLNNIWWILSLQYSTKH